MPSITSAPGAISWKTASGPDAIMLNELQPNIVKGHVRKHLSILFLKFDNAADGRLFLQSVSTAPGLMKSASAHLTEVEAHRVNPTKKGTVYVGVGLTAAGYDLLEIPKAKQPKDPSFQSGMRNAVTRTKLADPVISALEPTYQGEIHCVLLIGDEVEATVQTAEARIRTMMAGVSVVGTETGLGQENENGDGIEHFGYVDGRSQPLFLAEDVAAERSVSTGVSAWDPAFGIKRLVVADKAAPAPTKHFGSYFIFRKLEQNVHEFKLRELKLAADLGLQGEDKERAGAMIIGRFEDGTPVTSQSLNGMHSPVTNNFNYDDDVDGMKCPYVGHVRKVNPRGTGGFETVAGERKHLMARRGQTYGVRTDGPNDGEIDNKPSTGVGLLFMAFNANIAEQFEFTQSTWANNPGFPKTTNGQAAGVDLVIAQGTRPANVRCPVAWAGDQMKSAPTIPQTVMMKGGEYFFMPSLAFLRSL
jgi:Dyp-type peroxidase family